MKYINVIYDYEFDEDNNLIYAGDSDILLVPDFVHDNLDTVLQNYFNWVDNEVRKSNREKYPEYWIQLSDGKICLGNDSEHFVKWINNNFFHYENQNAIITKIGVEYNPNYPTALF